MNGIPMKLDYSKTINEQLGTFNYYRNRYACYELELMRDRQQLDQLTNNWNELENYVGGYIYLLKTNPDIVEEGQIDTLYEVLDKMNEIKDGNNER